MAKHRRKVREVAFLPLTPSALSVTDPDAEMTASGYLPSIVRNLDDEVGDEFKDKLFDVLPHADALLICRAFGIGEPKRSIAEIARAAGMTSYEVRRQRDVAFDCIRREIGFTHFLEYVQ